MDIPFSTQLTQNIQTLHELLPIDKSFDFVTRELTLGQTKAYWIGINGFYKSETLQNIFSDLQNPSFSKDDRITDLIAYMNAKVGFSQIKSCNHWDTLIGNLLSGPSLLFVDGFGFAIMIDARSYPARGIEEPDTERVTIGSKDGFVETMLLNANLIRRRVRSKQLIFASHSIGKISKTDVSVAYLQNQTNPELLKYLEDTLDHLNITSLTMGAKSLAELLVPHKWFHPLPSIQFTQRPDVACSYLMEGHILILVDNSPLVLIIPGTIFQFMQSPEDYYKAPLVGSYLRLLRFLCIPITTLLMPLFLLLTAFCPPDNPNWQLISTEGLTPTHIIVYVFAVEFLLDLLKYAAAINTSSFSTPMSIVGGLLIGDIAVNLHWASPEVIFYGAVSLLASLSISSIEFAEGLRLYRIFMLLLTAIMGVWGFGISLMLVILSVLTTPTLGGFSYFWPLIPWNFTALKTLLLRTPTTKAQPVKTWNRGTIQEK